MVAEKSAFEMASHEGMEGPMMAADCSAHTVVQTAPVSDPIGASVKTYDVVAINVNFVLNRVQAVRAQESLGEEEYWGLSLDVGSDAIQPLTIRANIGDCLVVTMESELPEPASFSIHGADVLISSTQEPALTTNPDSSALSGDTVVYEWFIYPAYYDENTHYARSHGARERFRVGHGLFGDVVVGRQARSSPLGLAE